jgi:hypothetical protein
LRHLLGFSVNDPEAVVCASDAEFCNHLDDVVGFQVELKLSALEEFGDGPIYPLHFDYFVEILVVSGVGRANVFVDFVQLVDDQVFGCRVEPVVRFDLVHELLLDLVDHVFDVLSARRRQVLLHVGQFRH